MAMFELTPKEAKTEIIKLLEANLVPALKSSPGMGKSSLVKEIAQEFNLKLIDIRLSQYDPADLQGLPMRIPGERRAEHVTFDTFPISTDSLPEGYDGWLIFFDEYNSCAKATQAAAYKIILDRMVGNANLHENAFIVCAGNRDDDKAITVRQSTAMQSRLTHLFMRSDFREFSDHAMKSGYDSRVIGFLESQPHKLHVFDPDHQDCTFPCPRTWEFVSKYITGRTYEDISTATLAGQIGSGPAVEFYTFLQEADLLPSFGSILRDPTKTMIPDKKSTQYALVSLLLSKIERDQFATLDRYMQRIRATEIRVLFYRGVFFKFPDIFQDPDFRQATKEMTLFLHGKYDDPAAA